MKSKTKNKHIFLVGAFAIIAVMALLAMSAKPSLSTTYTDAKNGFSINLPEGTEIISGADGRDNLVAFRVNENQEPYTVSVSAVPGVLSEEAQQQLLDTYETTLPSFQLISEHDIMLDGKQALQLTFSWARQGAKIVQEQIIVNGEGKLFVLTLTTDERQYGGHSDSFGKLLQTFKII